MQNQCTLDRNYAYKNDIVRNMKCSINNYNYAVLVKDKNGYCVCEKVWTNKLISPHIS